MKARYYIFTQSKIFLVKASTIIRKSLQVYFSFHRILWIREALSTISGTQSQMHVNFQHVTLRNILGNWSTTFFKSVQSVAFANLPTIESIKNVSIQICLSLNNYTITKLFTGLKARISALNLLTTNFSHHIETSQLISIANQLARFYMMGEHWSLMG